MLTLKPFVYLRMTIILTDPTSESVNNSIAALTNYFPTDAEITVEVINEANKQYRLVFENSNEFEEVQRSLTDSDYLIAEVIK